MWWLALFGCYSLAPEPVIDMVAIGGTPAIIDTKTNYDENGNLLDSIESVFIQPKWTYRIGPTDPVDEWPVVRFDRFIITYEVIGSLAEQPPPFEGVVAGSMAPGETVDVSLRPAYLEQIDWFVARYDGVPVMTTASLEVTFSTEDNPTVEVTRVWPFELMFADLIAGGVVVVEGDDTDSPDTDSPDTDSPDTDSPDTDSPDTDSPDTDSPDTNALDTGTDTDGNPAGDTDTEDTGT